MKPIQFIIVGLLALNGVASSQEIEVLQTRTITPEGAPYAGWATLGKRANGELWVVWSGGREAHRCPFGQVHAMKSVDQGQTWTHPRVLLDGPLDDRDAGFLETSKGTLLVTTFNSSHRTILDDVAKVATWDPEKLRRWQAELAWTTAEQDKQHVGQWLIRSEDGGVTWSPVIATVVSSPHGPTELKDGRLLYVGKELRSTTHRFGSAVSTDDGKTWQWLSEIPSRPGDKPRVEYHEPHAVEADDGTIIAHIRNHHEADNNETLQTESKDGGKTWSEPRLIGVWGNPSHLLKLRDGRLLMSYSHRRKPYGNQARVSVDHGQTWSEALLISADGTHWDLGYPSTVELDDGSLLTVWYEARVKGQPAILRQAHWRFNETAQP